MKRAQALELRRKKVALLGLWNRIAKELGGSQAQENIRNLQIAGRLLEACQDRQGLFETRARKFLNESWRSYRRLSDLWKAWEVIGEKKGTPSSNGTAKLSEPCGPNVFGYWKPPAGWNDPENLSHEELKKKAGEILARLRGLSNTLARSIEEGWDAQKTSQALVGDVQVMQGQLMDPKPRNLGTMYREERDGRGDTVDAAS